MTHYGPSPPPPSRIGLANDGTSIKLLLSGTDSFGLIGSTVAKELNYDEAVELARRLLNEAVALLKRGV
jgi:hypothetical protein